MAAIESVRVGPFAVADAVPSAVSAAAVEGWAVRDGAFVLMALHVGGLQLRRSTDYVQALGAADLVYADGASVVFLAKAAGATQISRCPTTDFGHQLLEDLTERMHRPPTIALVGGPRGLAERAGKCLIDLYGVEVVMTTHGFHDDWRPVIDDLAARSPEVLLLGLGTELEASWTGRFRHALGHTLVVTCGGWFGFLAGDEPRAPQWMQSVQLEWLYRMGLAPRRLGPRYARGLLAVASLLPRLRPQQ